MGTLADECKKASDILQQFIEKDEIENGFDTIIPVSVMKQAKGLAIFTVLKAGFIWSGRAGHGLVMARLPSEKKGGWSAPSALGIGGIGLGAQLGADMTHVVLILNSAEAVEAFCRGGNVTLGGNLSISAGPLGAGNEASIVPDKNVPIFAYSKSKGLFAGMSVEGTGMLELQAANTQFYGHPVRASALLKGEIDPPSEADVLYQKIHQAESRDPY
ncbi:hypothetical protein BD560DRAFT_454978 [Blakeslea trispora]|nr:hypothetical protein BD560DRAFT_454978 [Blakeslea trispora]